MWWGVVRGHILRPVRFKQAQGEQIPDSRDRRAYVLVWREVMIINVSNLGYGFGMFYGFLILPEGS